MLWMSLEVSRFKSGVIEVNAHVSSGQISFGIVLKPRREVKSNYSPTQTIVMTRNLSAKNRVITASAGTAKAGRSPQAAQT